ncbi:class F sortase [Actinokineospora sp.]|uniref:class F sortase n=1 Tax=Actinokineospora sp. TaxID=1872133 RepID=UPI004037F37F
MTRRWRLATPAAAGVVGLLVAVVLGGDVSVSGRPIAGAVPVSTPDTPHTPATAVSAGAVGAYLPARPEPPATKPPAPPEPVGQQPGTVRLTKGGTATLVRRELGPDATLPVPDGVREATWWGAGLDATAGATVLAGHVNWRGQTGPFAELWGARAGDAVSVVDAEGRTWRYRVAQVETVTKHDLPVRAEEFFGQRGPHRLVLVTCGGQWVGGQGGYESNRIVVARPE